MIFPLLRQCRLKHILISVLMLLPTSGDLRASNQLVTGKYTFTSDTDMVLNLSIQHPAPANLIVEQYLSAENKIAKTTPQAQKIDSNKGNVKWLFKKTKAGNLALSTILEGPLSGKVSAMVRYRTPQTGSFTELRITH